MKPFNLEAALKGAKVVTRSGLEVTQVVKFDVPLRMCVAGVIGENVFWWTEKGTSSGGRFADLDLMMYEPKKKKARIVIEWEE